MKIWNRKTIRVAIPVDLTDMMAPIIQRLLRDDGDGGALRTALRPFFIFTRPIIEIVRGATTDLYVEGPLYDVGKSQFPLGAALRTNAGWAALGPSEAAELSLALRDAVDSVIFRWLGQQDRLDRLDDCSPRRCRPADDHVALDQMVAIATTLQQNADICHA